DVMQQVVDRWFELRAAEFGQSNMETIINGMADEIREAQARSFVRWTNPAPGSISGQNFSEAGTTGWERDVSHLKGWLKARSEWIDQQFFLPPTFNKNGGVVEEGFQLTMNSNDATVYYMTDGSDPRAPGGGTAIGAIPFDGGPIDEVLLAEDSSCQYFVPLDASLQTTWFLPEFEDTDWFSGTSGLGFESRNGSLNSEITTNIKSTMQPSANGSNNASAYFRFEFDFDNADSINRLLLEIKYDDSFVAYLNGTEVARSDSAPASVAWNSSGSSGPSDSTLVNYSFNSIADNSFLDYDITANKALIINGTNVLALQVMNSSSGGSDFLVKPRISANHTVVATPIVVNGSSTIVARAYDGQQWGGPTSATFVVGSELADATNLVVSEVMYNPIGATAAEINAGFLDGDLFEYVELLNISASPIDLSEVSFSNGIDFDFLGAAITELDPDARLLVVRNQAAFEQRYGVGFSNLIAGEFANDTNLANSGERVAIEGAGGVIRNFRYDDTAPWPLLPDGFGPSLVLLAPNSNLDHALSESWAASTAPLGSPGEGDGGTTFSGDPNADIDNDGLSAFAEYAFGTSDTDPAAGKGIVTTSVDDNGLFTVSFPKNSNATDAQIGVEISGDLIDWTPAGAMLALDSVIYNGDGTATVTYKSANPVAQGDRLFVRLRTSSL
ncbi:MAG: CotH kinase family protein, partial [Akkermansiaceae bacterium]|nr:CotH kinase family protein [Akkermansiaceae bacterium]